MRLPSSDMDKLELLLIAHPGELELINGDRGAFLSIFSRVRGHDHDGWGRGSGRREGGNALRIHPAGSPSTGGT